MIEFENGFALNDFLMVKDDGLVRKGAKTKKYTVRARLDKSFLGYIKWFAVWRKYCFYSYTAIFDPGCLRELATFCDELTDEHKAKTRFHRVHG